MTKRDELLDRADLAVRDEEWKLAVELLAQCVFVTATQTESFTEMDLARRVKAFKGLR